MKLRTTLTALACLTSGAGMAHAAQTIASAPLWTGLSHAGACYIRNVGTRPVSLTVSPLINFTPGFRTADFDNCNNNDGVPLQPGHTCVLLMNALDDDVTFACSAVVNGSAKNVRGNVEIRESVTGGQRVIAADEMR